MLRNYSFIDLKIQGLLDQYNELFTTATHITPNYESEGGGTHDNESRIEKQTIKLAELAAKIGKEKAKKVKIEKALKKLRPYRRFLITRIDIKGESVNRLARRTHKDPSSLAKVHNRALDELEI